MLRSALTLVSALTASLAFSSPSQAGQSYLAVILGSRHFGNDYLNDRNPGLLLGQRWPLGEAGAEIFVEGGVFYNSYREISPMLLLGGSLPLFDTGPIEWRGGIAFGTAYYDELSQSLEESYGIPNVGGFIPVAMASVAARIEQHELRFTAVPPDTDTDFILNLSYTYAF